MYAIEAINKSAVSVSFLCARDYDGGHRMKVFTYRII